jgi:hypothetical protein
MKSFLIFGALAATLILPSRADADSLTFNNLGSGAWVTVTQGSSTVTGWAGEINWLLKTPTDTVGKAFQSYCSDLFDDAKLPTQLGTLETTTSLSSATTVNAQPNAGAMAAYLANTYGNTAHGSNDAAAGLQIAIWNALYGAGAFAYSASSAGVSLAANAFYGGLLSALSSDPSVVLASTAPFFDVFNSSSQIGTAANGQDQIGVPEPAPILLLMMAMAGLLWYQQMSRRQGASAYVWCQQPRNVGKNV